MTAEPNEKPTEDTTPDPKSAFETPSELSLEMDEPPPEKTDDADEKQTPQKSDVEILRDENAQLKDQALRALAEAENTRRRAERDRDDAGKYAIANFARGLLSVADNLRRAIDAIPSDIRETEGAVAAVIAGIEATERELLAAFDKVNIRKIDAMDVPFNPNHHEVMFETPGTGKQPGTIIQVIEDGYMIHDRLLRPARVGVAKADAGTPPPEHTIDTQA
jgi:molecular chaperone GrpE